MPQQESAYSQGVPEGSEQGRKKSSNMLLKAVIPIVVVVALSVGAYFLFFNKSSPPSAVEAAIENLGVEVIERLNTTPLKAFGMMGGILNDGTLTIDFKYVDDWNSEETSGIVKISSDMEERDMAIAAEITAYGDTYDLELFINKERMAFGSSLLGNDYFGFNYDTFLDDFRILGSMLALDSEITNIITGLVDSVSLLINAEETSGYANNPFDDIFSDMEKRANTTSEKTNINSGGTTVSCTKVETVLKKEAIIAILKDYYKVFQEDEAIREQFELFDNPAFGFSNSYRYNSFYDEFMDQFNDLIDQAEDIFTGDIKMTYYIGDGDRLLRCEYSIEIDDSGDNIIAEAIFDFGASAKDRWSLKFSATQGGIVIGSSEIIWDYVEKSNSIENIIKFSEFNGSPTTFRSVWSPGNGDFTLSFEDDWDYAEITGAFTVDGDSFRLSMNNLIPDYVGDSLTFGIRGEPGAQIKQIDYINIDKWADSLMEVMENLYSANIIS